MRRRREGLIVLVLFMTALVSCALVWQLAPDPFGLIPVQIRMRLPEEVIAYLSTPIPTALPAPLINPNQSQPVVILPELSTATPSPSATAPPLIGEILPPTFTPAVESTLEATATSTSTPTATPTSTSSPTPTVPPVVVLEGMDVIAQQFNNCGPANLTMVLNYHQIDTNQTVVGNSLKPSYEDRNVSPDEMVAFVEQSTDLNAAFYSGGDIDLLKQLIANGFPVIIERGFLPSETLGWMGHYLTLFGFDESEDSFLTMDSYLGPWDSSGRSESYQSIAELWEHFNNTFIVVYRPEDRQNVSEILGENFGSPDVMWLNSALKAQARTEQDPDNAFAWFNLGTSLTELGEITGEAQYYENAALAYDRAREVGLPWRMLWYQFKPYRAYLEVDRVDEVLALTLSAQSIEETHLYRGHALLAAGDLRGAEYSYRRALQMNPNFTPAEEALASLSQ